MSKSELKELLHLIKVHGGTKGITVNTPLEEIKKKLEASGILI